jgi:LCP family protein required for cell wall assembly
MSHVSTPQRSDSDAPSRRRGGRGRKRERTGKRRVGRWILLTLTVLVLASAGTAYWLYSDLNGNIKGVDLDEAIGDDRPEKLPTSGQNLLVLGSDSRSGANSDLDGGSKISGARSDTALVIHIPEGREKAVAVSIPRDTLVTRPKCTTRDGSALPSAKRVMFNSVYSLAGPACVVKTVEQMSGVRMDHLMEVDFAGFKGLVDAIGGVTVTLDEAIEPLNLSAGTHELDGEQSLKFVRTRYGYGDGSDLGRIGLQQQFMIALLSDPSTMETIMLPVKYDTQDPNRVVAAQPQAGQLWKAIRTDEKIPESAKKSPANGGKS